MILTHGRLQAEFVDDFSLVEKINPKVRIKLCASNPAVLSQYSFSHAYITADSPVLLRTSFYPLISPVAPLTS